VSGLGSIKDIVPNCSVRFDGEYKSEIKQEMIKIEKKK